MLSSWGHDLLSLPLDTLQHIASFLSIIEVGNLAVCKQLISFVQARDIKLHIFKNTMREQWLYAMRSPSFNTMLHAFARTPFELRDLNEKYLCETVYSFFTSMSDFSYYGITLDWSGMEKYLQKDATALFLLIAALRGDCNGISATYSHYRSLYPKNLTYIPHPHPLSLPLAIATISGQIDAVRLLLHAEWASDSFLILCMSILFGRESIVDFFIEQLGVDADVRARMGCSPLHLAAEANRLRIMRALVERHGANVDATTNDKDTPLIAATRCGNAECVRYLLAHGAHADMRNLKEHTPLSIAAEAGRSDIVADLIRHGVSVNTSHGFALTPLHYACLGRHLDVVRMLLEHGAHARATTASNESPLHLAAERGFEEVVRVLVAAGCDVHTPTRGGISPLLCAVMGLHAGVVKILLERGADANAHTREGMTVLSCAIAARHEGIVRALVEYGADVNTPVDYDNTPLHMAVHANEVGIVGVLLENGAWVDAVNMYEHTPLHMAAQEGRVEITKLLLEHRANVNIVAKGVTPIQFAVQGGHEDVVSMLVGFGANVNDITSEPLQNQQEVGYCRIS